MSTSITPRDTREAAAIGAGRRIAAAIAAVAAAAPAILAAIGGLEWIAANLPLLLAGIGSLAAGGVTSYVAVRRMLADSRKPTKEQP